MEEKTHLSGINLFFLWFGAAVSVAEILTGGYLAELGAAKGLWAILLGHLAGTLLLVLAGLIGFREKVPAIMSTRISFGKQGSYLISVINILQLVGWTAIMIIEGGMAMNVISRTLWHFDHPTLMHCLIGLFVGLWVFWGVKGFKRINTLAAALLLILTVVMSWVVFTSPSGAAEMAQQKGAFGMGFEFSIIMPLSWFPVATVSLVAGIAFYYLVKLQELLIGPTLTTIVFTTALHYTLRRWGRWGKAPESRRDDG
jgi:putative hydroxymethylpyrimidine transporter CytX